MKVLYIGQYTEGTTSKMRCDTLKQLLQPTVFEIIDTHVPFFKTHALFRRLGFRYKTGPLIRAVNVYIQSALGTQYDLIWVDKAVFMSLKTTKLLRAATKLLVHYTPDAAFEMNRSRHFENSLNQYDFAITTKSFEMQKYRKFLRKDQLLWVPQGFDKQTHRALVPFEKKEAAITFIGLNEPSREAMLQTFLNAGFKVYLAGKKWGAFVKKYQGLRLKYLGEGLFGEQYTASIAKSQFAWGAISKRFPELHTTRTFEIPACGTALLTAENEETGSFFKPDEVIFYKTAEDLVSKIKYYLSHQKELEALTLRGQKRVGQAGYDYASILTDVCIKIGILKTT
jgi:spore maturation protein CgeB